MWICFYVAVSDWFGYVSVSVTGQTSKLNVLEQVIFPEKGKYSSTFILQYSDSLFI